MPRSFSHVLTVHFRELYGWKCPKTFQNKHSRHFFLGGGKRFVFLNRIFLKGIHSVRSSTSPFSLLFLFSLGCLQFLRELNKVDTTENKLCYSIPTRLLKQTFWSLHLHYFVIFYRRLFLPDVKLFSFSIADSSLPLSLGE